MENTNGGRNTCSEVNTQVENKSVQTAIQFKVTNTSLA